MALTENKGIPSDHRVKIRCLDHRLHDANGLLTPLQTAGNFTTVYFPLTPVIQFGHNVNYGTHDLTHTNYQPHYYVNTPNPTISISAIFVSQTVADAQYAAAALHFFRSLTKMDFGASGNTVSDTAGIPPPVCKLTAYGDYNLKGVPVVVRSFNYHYDNDVDYVTFESHGKQMSIPSQFVIQLDLGVQHAPGKVRKEFNLDSYYSGDLLSRGYI